MRKYDNLNGECIGDIHTDAHILHRLAVNQRLSVFGMRLCPECGRLVDVDFHVHGEKVLYNPEKHKRGGTGFR